MKTLIPCLLLITITASYGVDVAQPITTAEASEIHKLESETLFSGALVENRGSKSRIVKVQTGSTGVSGFVLQPGARSYIKLVTSSIRSNDIKSSLSKLLMIKSEDGSAVSLNTEGRLMVVISEQGEVSGSGSLKKWAFLGSVISEMTPSIIVVYFGAELTIEESH